MIEAIIIATAAELLAQGITAPVSQQSVLIVAVHKTVYECQTFDKRYEFYIAKDSVKLAKSDLSLKGGNKHELFRQGKY